MASARLLNTRPVFVVTNLGTRIVVVVPVECTVAHFKEEFKSAHFSCFPELGTIYVDAVKLRRKSCFYDIAESFPLRYAFESAKGWFLHVVVYRVENPSAFKKTDRRILRKKWKKRKTFPCFKAAFFKVPRGIFFLKRTKKKHHRNKKVRELSNQIKGIKEEPIKLKEDRVLALESSVHGDLDIGANLGTEEECRTESISETVSISGIISRYFSNCDEVSSNSRVSFMESIEQIKAKRAVDYENIPSPLIPTTPAQVHCETHHGPNSKPLERKPRSTVGVRVVEASKSFGLSTSKKSCAHSLSKFIDGGSMVTRSDNTHVRRLIFEIPDEDD